MTMFLRETPASAVVDERTFASYAHQMIGTKYPNVREMITLRKRTNQFFTEYPLADWATLVQTVAYLRGLHRRVDYPWAVLNFVPGAYRDGILPELDPRNHEHREPDVEAQIVSILATESDPWWVGAMTLATEPAARRDLVQMWRNRVV
jgi:hypothetical protein